MFYNNKASYFGNYCEGKRHGEGLFTFQNKGINIDDGRPLQW